MEVSKSCWLFFLAATNICAGEWSLPIKDVIRLFAKYNVGEFLSRDGNFEVLDCYSDDEIAGNIERYINSVGGTVYA